MVNTLVPGNGGRGGFRGGGPLLNKLILLTIARPHSSPAHCLPALPDRSPHLLHHNILGFSEFAADSGSGEQRTHRRRQFRDTDIIPTLTLTSDLGWAVEQSSVSNCGYSGKIWPQNFSTSRYAIDIFMLHHFPYYFCLGLQWFPQMSPAAAPVWSGGNKQELVIFMDRNLCNGATWTNSSFLP